MNDTNDKRTDTDKFLRQFCIAPANRKAAIIESAARILDGLPEDSLVYSASQAARLLSCSRQTIWRLEKDNVLHPVIIRGLRRFRRSDLIALIGEKSL